MTGANRHILIVEDAEDLQFLLKQLFRDEGFTLSYASNGKEALDKLQAMTELPSVILLDIMMPIMDGIEFREKQLQTPRLSEIPVVVMTADSNPQQKLTLMKAKDFVRKPIADVDHLIATVEKYMS